MEADAMSGQHNKQKILASARELFYHVGYQTTSVDDILKRCGVAKSNFYYHFKSKEELAAVVIELQIEDFEALLLTTLQNRALDPAQRVSEFFDCLGRMQAEHQQLGGCPFGNLVAALSNTGDEQAERFRQRLSLLFRKTESTMSDCLTEGVKLRQFRNDILPADLARVLLATVEGL